MTDAARTERRQRALLPRHVFLRRVARGAAIAFAVLGGSLALGAFGYHTTEGLDWLDALLNAAMILTGMGPVAQLHTAAGKLFATFYALYSGVAFIGFVGLLFGPIFHRFLHRFHLELGAGDEPGGGDEPKT